MSPKKIRSRYAVIGYSLCSLAILSAVMFYFARQEPEVAPENRQYVDTVVETPVIRAKELLNIESSPSRAKTIEVEEFSGVLAELIPSEEETAVLFEAEELVIANCMNERGFEYRPSEYRSTEELIPWSQTRDPQDTESAIISGYGLAERILVADLPPQSDSIEELSGGLPASEHEAWITALQGSPDNPDSPGSSEASVVIPGIGTMAWDTNSCTASARRAVYGDDRAYMQGHAALTEMINIIDKKVAHDPQYMQAITTWSECMKSQGFAYKHPQAAQGDLVARYEAGKLDLNDLREEEIKVAAADSHCHMKAGLSDALTAAEQRADAEVRSSRQSEITELASNLKESLRRAESMIGSEIH